MSKCDTCKHATERDWPPCSCVICQLKGKYFLYNPKPEQGKVNPVFASAFAVIGQKI